MTNMLSIVYVRPYNDIFFNFKTVLYFYVPALNWLLFNSQQVFVIYVTGAHPYIGESNGILVYDLGDDESGI